MFQKKWTPEQVLEHITCLKDTEPLNSHHISLNHSGLYAAACRIFGSWGEAIAACGMNYDQIRKYQRWNEDGVISVLQERSLNKEPMTCQYVQCYERSLYMAAVHYFGSWRDAMVAAEVDYNSIRMRRSLTADEIKEEIIELFESGEDLAYPNMRKNYLYLLTYGSRKLGNGSWVEARKQCGIRKNFRKRRYAPSGYLEPELFPVDRSEL